VAAGSFTDVTVYHIANHLISTAGWRRFSELKSATVNEITYP
jgi:hypothetical protein